MEDLSNIQWVSAEDVEYDVFESLFVDRVNDGVHEAVCTGVLDTGTGVLIELVLTVLRKTYYRHYLFFSHEDMQNELYDELLTACQIDEENDSDDLVGTEFRIALKNFKGSLKTISIGPMHDYTDALECEDNFYKPENHVVIGIEKNSPEISSVQDVNEFDSSYCAKPCDAGISPRGHVEELRENEKELECKVESSIENQNDYEAERTEQKVRFAPSRLIPVRRRPSSKRRKRSVHLKQPDTGEKDE